MKTLISLLLVSFAQNAIAETVTLDFDNLAHSGTIVNYVSVIEDGYQLVNSHPRPTSFNVYGDAQPTEFYINTGSPTLTASRQLSSITLSRPDALVFDLISIDLATISAGLLNPSAAINFTGTLTNGSTVSQTFNFGNQLTTYLFSNFNDVTKVSWLQDADQIFIAHQFDNIVVKSSVIENVNAVPLPAAAWLFGSSLIGFFGLSRKLST
ncbi:MAG: VPLPA-CTERM sorting domain-containing protein [Methylotenera sp.]|nr:VPLPA-CTERM sorting domain-containing protein [Methylotenera sp.]